VDGRRITDDQTLKVVTMVYAGFINKNIVATLHAFGCAATGITGADGNAILAHKRVKGLVDYGFAGDVDKVQASYFVSLLQQELAVVVAPITHDGKGQLLNTNADTIANEIATALSSQYDVQLVYCFEKAGVLLDAADESSVIPAIDPAKYEALKQNNQVFAGMLPKLDNAFAAIKKGVRMVVIGKAEALPQLVNGQSGTTIVHER
jgi:acetylglutamate kinase